MLTENEWETIKQEIQMLLHAHRDCLRNQGKDTKNILFDARDGYYGEAFGILRTLALLGYGTLDQPCNIPEIRTNLHWWFYKIQREELDSNGMFHLIQRYYENDFILAAKINEL